MRPLFRFLAALLLTAHCSLFIAKAQAPKTYTSSEILLGLKKLNVLGSVLYIAAHPDDENTRLLAYLANERLVETAYLSCTRGDGGQNLIGPELREQLGVIRTQELLAARRIDGAQQFFTRANDFGFSKTAEETFTIWDREQVLADMVWVIRQRRPDVLITRFPPDARAGHGHHAASAILAIEAFAAAGDPKRFPEQLQYVQAWQPKRLLWNTGGFFVKAGESMAGKLALDAGGFNPLLGKSYGEIAALSRSQHRSQGMGTAATRGEALEYFQALREGDAVPTELFEGVDMTWGRLGPGGVKVGKMIEKIIREFDANNPTASLHKLRIIEYEFANFIARSKICEGSINCQYRSDIVAKFTELQQLEMAMAGVYIEATASSAAVAPGEIVSVKIDITNRSKQPIGLDGVFFNWAITDSTLFPKPLRNCVDCQNEMYVTLEPQKTYSQTFPLKVPIDQPANQPYWLREKPSIGMYALPDTFGTPISQFMGYRQQRQEMVIVKDLIGAPENPSAAYVYADVLAGIWPNFKIPIQYKHTDPVLGELYQPLAVVPPVAVNLPAARAYVFADAQAKPVPVTLRAGKAGVKGTLALQAPTGWQIEPASIPFDLTKKDEEQTVTFQLRPLPGAAPGKADLQAVATVDGQQYRRGLQTINYPHIPTQTLFPEATAPLVRLDVRRKGQQIGYLMGAGDEVPEALRQLGYTVTLLDASTDLTAERLRRYDAVVLGIRAYNTVDKLKTQQPELLQYVEQGGNLVVQYVVTRGTVLPQIGPYPLTLSNDRVAVETAPVTFLQPQHPLLNTPNKITAADFSGWVQEQGLYYPNAWDAKYTPVIASHDPGETDKQSAILVADYGKGHYIYTGLSLFRELPAGVPGAYRILANLVSYGK